MQALALDFDGVISDSAAEAFAVALPTYLAMRPVEAWAELAGAVRGLSRDALVVEPLYRAFLDVMPLGNRAEDFGVALRALETAEPLEDQATYDRFRAGLGTGFCEEYHERFYVERRAFRDSDHQGWLGLLAPYPAFIEILRRRAPEVRLAVATAKDRPSVDTLLGAYGIADLFDPDLVLDKEVGPDKRAHLTALADRLDLPPREITFIDDKVNHLDSVSQLGVRCGLATWGYNGEREHIIALERGYLLLDLDTSDQALFESSPAAGRAPR